MTTEQSDNDACVKENIYNKNNDGRWKYPSCNINTHKPMKCTNNWKQFLVISMGNNVIAMVIKMRTKVCHYITNVSICRNDSEYSLDISEVKESLVKSSSTISSAAEDPELEDGESISGYGQSKYPDSSPELWQWKFTAGTGHGLRSVMMYSLWWYFVVRILTVFGDDVIRGDSRFKIQDSNIVYSVNIQ